MLVIRLRRVGRKGLPHYRVVVQDSRWSAKSGKFVAQLGSYDPKSKKLTVDKEKSEKFLKNGAQPSERIVLLFKKEGVKLPSWVPKPTKKQGKPKAKKEGLPAGQAGGEAPAEGQPAPAAAEAPAAEAQPEQPAEEKPAETVAEEPKAEETPEAEKPAE